MLRSVLKNKNTQFGKALINTAQRNFAYEYSSFNSSLLVLLVLILEPPTPVSPSWKETIQKSLKTQKVSAPYFLHSSWFLIDLYRYENYSIYCCLYRRRSKVSRYSSQEIGKNSIWKVPEYLILYRL